MRRDRTRRRVGLEIGVSRERWLVSYADFITLLFAFFTTLYAISVVDLDKARKLSNSLQASFGQRIFDEPTGERGVFDAMLGSLQESETQGLDPEPAETPLPDPPEGALGLFGERVRQTASALGVSADLQLRETGAGLVISLAESLLFPRAGVRPAAASRRTLREIGLLLRELPNHVRIEGHTDNVPIRTPAYPSNCHLSGARAVEVLLELERAGVPAYRLSASGFADQRPLVSNGTEQGRRINRRVDIVVLRPGGSPGPADLPTDRTTEGTG